MRGLGRAGRSRGRRRARSARRPRPAPLPLSRLLGGALTRLLGGALTRLAERRARREESRSAGDAGRSLYRLHPDGRGVRYHVYAGGLRRGGPGGVVVYLDGDYWLPALSRFHRPRGRTMRGLAATAAEHGAALVAVDTPDRAVGVGGLTWWVRHRENARWLRGFLDVLPTLLPFRPRHIWVMGYSGGAELLAAELRRLLPSGAGPGETDPADAGAWETVSAGADPGEAEPAEGPAVPLAGAVMVGGGDPGNAPVPPPGEHAGLPLLWWIGDRDGSPDPPRPLWSAARAAQRGATAYRAAGWTGASLRVVPGTGHRSYDLPAVLRASLARGGRG